MSALDNIIIVWPEMDFLFIYFVISVGVGLPQWNKQNKTTTKTRFMLCEDKFVFER